MPLSVAELLVMFVALPVLTVGFEITVLELTVTVFSSAYQLSFPLV